MTDAEWWERQEKRDAERDRIEALRRKNGYHPSTCGDYTGRCGRCGSSNLWDDNLAYGCNDCGMFRCP